MTILGLTFCGVQNADHVVRPSPPNFVVILSEAHGWSSISVPSDPAMAESKSRYVNTPALAQLAERGMRFSHAYASSPRCTPSRAALLTGKSPAQLHMTFVMDDSEPGNRFGGQTGAIVPPRCVLELPESEVTIAETLKSAGYGTAHFGKWHMGRRDPAVHGFDESDGPTSNRGPGGNEKPNPQEAHGITERGIAFARRQVQAGKPFYLQLSHYSARNEADVSAEYLNAFTKRTGVSDPRIASACAAVEEMDATIGQLLSALEELHVADNTYVIYTTDHGTQGRNENAPLSQGKGTLWEGGIRVPLIIRGPGIAPGSACTVPAIGHDLYPTICALAGVTTPLPAGVEGGSLRSVLMSGGGTVNRPFDGFVFHFPHYDHDSQGPGTAIITGDYKLIRYYESGTKLLFNLADDVGEKRDLSTTQPERVTAMELAMDKYLQQVNAQMPIRSSSTGTPQNSNVPSQSLDKPRQPGKKKEPKQGRKRKATL